MSHKLIRAGAVAGLVGLAAGAARAQDCLWTQRAVSGPSARYDHAMAYDVARARVVLFGGRERFPLNGVFGDTWEWDGAAWTQRQVAGPAPRWAHAMAYNPDQQRIVLFGGSTNAGFLGDTWEWDGLAWLQRPGPSPSARTGHSMAFDPVRRGVLLQGSATETDTWLYLQGWSLVGNGPLGRNGAMAADTVRNRVVFFGDCCSGNPWVYEWNGFSWTGPFGQGPPERGALAFDPGRGKTVMFGGRRDFGQVRGDTWEWNGTGWTMRTQGGPPARSSHAMAFDTARGRAVMFGGAAEEVGFSDTWEWNGNAGAPGLVITQQPTFSGGPPGSSAMLSVTATGNGPLVYQWRREGVLLVNGGSVSGANTATLTINPTVCADSGRYDVVLTDGCGSGVSNPATIGVSCPPPSNCRANCDSSTIPPVLNVNDYVCFLMSYGAGCAGPIGCYPNCDESTMTPFLNVLDFVCFMNRYAAGCP